MRFQHKVPSHRRPTNLLVSSNLHRFTAHWLSTWMRVWRWVRLTGILQPMEVHEGLFAMRYRRLMHTCLEPSRDLWMPERLHRIAFQRMSRRVLRRCWLSRIATSLLLWNLQESLRRCLRCQRWLQPSRFDSNLLVSSRHDWRSVHQLPKVCTGRFVPPESMRKQRHLHSRLWSNTTRKTRVHMPTRLHRKCAHILR